MWEFEVRLDSLITAAVINWLEKLDTLENFNENNFDI